MEIVNSILLILINYFILKFLLKNNLKSLGYALIPSFVFIILNLFFGNLPKKLIPITLMYSFGLLILSFMSSQIDVTKNNKANISEENKATFPKIKSYIVNIVMPISIAIFQIILMFHKEMQREF